MVTKVYRTRWFWFDIASHRRESPIRVEFGRYPSVIVDFFGWHVRLFKGPRQP